MKKLIVVHQATGNEGLIADVATQIARRVNGDTVVVITHGEASMTAEVVKALGGCTLIAEPALSNEQENFRGAVPAVKDWLNTEAVIVIASPACASLIFEAFAMENKLSPKVPLSGTCLAREIDIPQRRVSSY